MKLQELKDALRVVDPAAVLVSHRLLARVIQEVHRLPTQFLQVPHQRSFVIDRQVLFRHVEQDELDLDPDRLLPQTVVLLVRPSSDDGDVPDRTNTLLKYWQRLFHASVDRAMDQRVKAGALTPEGLQARLAAIGEAEFDEIRSVLAQDLCLLPPVDDLEVYCEFVAVYLELRYFLPSLRSVYFPSLRNLEAIDAIVAQDVDGDAIYKATRLPGAPDPMMRGDRRSDDSHEYYWKLMRSADAASKAGNHVRAAILRMKAARVAPGALTLDTRTNAHMELQRLAHRLQIVMELSDADAAAWQVAMVSLLEKADQGPWTVEARLLYDLQQVCIDAERDVYKLDLVEWVLSAGKRPIKRPLPSQRLVQMTRHLRAANQRIPLARLSDNDRQHLTRLMQTALQQSQQQLRARFRPIFADALHDVGLVASNPPEETAFHKMIEELLDRITAAGFFTFGDLRDIISRNSLKLPDLADPQEFVRGDPLLRLDRRLATLLDGVYRPGEIYLRGLARSTSLMYGTSFGRNLTRNILLPFGGTLLTLWGLLLLIHHPLPEADWLPHVEGPKLPWELLWLTLPIGVFILSLMREPQLRRTCVKTCQTAGEILRLIIKAPGWLVRLPPVQRVWKSWLFQLFWWYAVKPLAVAVILWLLVLWPHSSYPLVSLAIAFAAVAVVINSRLGHAASEITSRALWQLYEKLRGGLIPGVIRFVMQLLKTAMDALEQVLYSIDEWLRFRTGDTQASLVVRTILGVLWYPIGFLTRLYVVVFVEPMFHPLKLPIAILAAKFVYIRYTDLVALQAQWLSFLGPELANALAIANTWLLPDLFGFLFWELRENWRLYRANRSPVLKPVMVGHHGETVLQLLKPGVHSGTVPRLFNHLRHAEREAMASGQWRTARAYNQQLLAVEEALRLFIERDLLVLLHQSRHWQDKPLLPGKIELATHLIRIELDHRSYLAEPARWAFAEKMGWLTVQIEQPGWLTKLPVSQLKALTLALAGWYKLAGVEVVREQVQSALAGSGLMYTLEARGLTLRSSPRVTEVVYPIADSVHLELVLSSREVKPRPSVPPVDQLIFGRVPIRWDAWVKAWLSEAHGESLDLPAGVGWMLSGINAASPNGNGEVTNQKPDGAETRHAQMLRHDDRANQLPKDGQSCKD